MPCDTNGRRPRGDRKKESAGKDGAQFLQQRKLRQMIAYFYEVGREIGLVGRGLRKFVDKHLSSGPATNT